MRRRMARTKKKVDPFEFPGSDDESDDDDKLSAKRKRRNSGNSTPHSVNGLDDGGGSTCRDEDGGRSTCRAKLCFPGSGNQSDTAASGTLTPPLPHARELRQRRGELHRFLRCEPHPGAQLQLKKCINLTVLTQQRHSHARRPRRQRQSASR